MGGFSASENRQTWGPLVTQSENMGKRSRARKS